MSVPVGARGENLSRLFTLSMDLLAEVIKAANNDKCVPHKLYKELALPLVESARNMTRCLYKANRAHYDIDRKRHAAQAMEHADDLRMEIHLNLMKFRFPAKRSVTVIDMLDQILAMTKKWLEAVCCNTCAAVVSEHDQR